MSETFPASGAAAVTASDTTELGRVMAATTATSIVALY